MMTKSGVGVRVIEMGEGESNSDERGGCPSVEG